MKVKLGNGKDMKEYGVHNGARGRIRGWTLHPNDEERLRDCTDGEVTLTELPSKNILFLHTPMRRQYPGLPEGHFPLSPVTTEWQLGGNFGDEGIRIRRRGFPLVPDFSTTMQHKNGKSSKKI